MEYNRDLYKLLKIGLISLTTIGTVSFLCAIFLDETILKVLFQFLEIACLLILVFICLNFSKKWNFYQLLYYFPVFLVGSFIRLELLIGIWKKSIDT